MVNSKVKFWVSFFVLFISTNIKGQNNLREEYEAFKRQTLQEYNDFRNRVNKEYAEFIRKTWEEYKGIKPIPLPKEDKVPPVVIDEDDKNKDKEDKLVIIDEVIDIPEPSPQPQPVSPIEEQPVPIIQTFTFVKYGTQFSVRLSDEHKFQLKNITEETIARQWELLASVKYNNIVLDCLNNREKYKLCDWAYLRMLDEMCSSFLGEQTNEAELLKAYIYSQSGYQMRLAISSNRLYMLYASQHVIYNKGYWNIDGMYYYADNCLDENIRFCKAAYPGEKALSLYISAEQFFSFEQTKRRVIKASDADWLKVIISENQNLMSFCTEYPASCIGGNFMTKWAMYANMPLSTNAKQQLYTQFEDIFENIKHSFQQESIDYRNFMPVCVDAICHWIQTGFEYEYDDNVWGHDRAFFADETLYYPYCDCEDRSILLTRMVRDLLGLKCALVYYPNHLATAIALGENIKGDYIRIDGTKFLICDPTYIGATIGKTMPNMNNKSAKVIVLD